MINPTIFSGKVIGARRAKGAYSAIVEVQDTDVWAEDEYGKTIADGEAGVDDTGILKEAIDKGSGKVLVRGNLILTEQVNVWGGVILDVENGYYLKNELADGWTPCLVFKQYSGIKKLAIDCNDKSGILVGEDGKVNEIKAEFINLWNLGKTYDAVKGSQIGVKFQGYAFHVDFLKVKGGNVACDFVSCSDAYIDTALLVDFVTGMRFSGCEHLFFSQVDLDTGSYIGIQVDTSHDINIKGTIWVNNTEYPGVSLTYGALVGEYSSTAPNTALNLKLKFLRHGGTALKLSYTEDSIFDIEISNADLYTTSPAIETGIEFGSGLSGDIVIRSDRDIDAATKVSGTPYGKLLIPKAGYNDGTATIKAGDTSVTVNHGLVATPSKILVTPYADTKFWVSNKTSTSFDINIPAALGADADFDWEAEV